MIETTLLSFTELSLAAFYEILALRSEVFIVEQHCFYQDLDYKDQEAMHLLMKDNNKLIAYARILPYDDGENMSFGRLVTAASHRGQGLSKRLIDLILAYLKTHHPQQAITITAQSYLCPFYERYGFIPKGEDFDMDGILHRTMVRPT